MSKFNAKTAIALLDSTKLASPQVKRFGDGVVQIFLNIAATEKLNARRAILIGMALPILKASMARGEFTPWMKANLTNGKNWSAATAIKNASLFTRLAHAFIEEKKVEATQILAITNGKALKGKPGKDPHSAKLLEAIDDFIGERSTNELINEYVSGSNSSSSSAGALPADDNTLLQEMAEWLINLRKTLVDPETLKRLTTQQINDAEKQLAGTLEDFRKAKNALKG